MMIVGFLAPSLITIFLERFGRSSISNKMTKNDNFHYDDVFVDCEIANRTEGEILSDLHKSYHSCYMLNRNLVCPL